MIRTDTSDKIWAFHNGDFSGDVMFILPVNVADMEEFVARNNELYIGVKIPYKDLETLVIKKMRSEVISSLEEMSDNDFLRTLNIINAAYHDHARRASSNFIVGQDH